jgi:hypothetical protein
VTGAVIPAEGAQRPRAGIKQPPTLEVERKRRIAQPDRNAIVAICGRCGRSSVKTPQCSSLVQGDVIGLITPDLVLRIILARMMDVAFVVHIRGVHLADPTPDATSLGAPAHVIADFERLCHRAAFLCS